MKSLKRKKNTTAYARTIITEGNEHANCIGELQGNGHPMMERRFIQNNRQSDPNRNYTVSVIAVQDMRRYEITGKKKKGEKKADW